MLPRVAFEYGQTWCAAWTISTAVSGSSTDGSVTSSWTDRSNPRFSLGDSDTFESTTASPVSTFARRATTPSALSKQDAKPTAKSCSGFVPPPGPPMSDGIRRSTSSSPSLVRPCPSRRPPVTVASAVYRTLAMGATLTGGGARGARGARRVDALRQPGHEIGAQLEEAQAPAVGRVHAKLALPAPAAAAPAVDARDVAEADVADPADDRVVAQPQQPAVGHEQLHVVAVAGRGEDDVADVLAVLERGEQLARDDAADLGREPAAVPRRGRALGLRRRGRRRPRLGARGELVAQHVVRGVDGHHELAALVARAVGV